MRTIRFFLLLPMLVLMSAISIAQTITSTSTGGNWEDVNSWIGGVVPGENNDVVITSIISVSGWNPICKNLTVNPGGILQNVNDIILMVLGNITNNGIIQNNSAGNPFHLYVYGNINNNGIWENSDTHLSSENDQHISQSIGKKFECKFGRTASNYGRGTGTIIADSDLTFTSDASFHAPNNWGTLNMSGHNLILEGEFSFYDVVVENIYKLITEEKVKLYSISFDSDVIIEGVASLFDSYYEASFQKDVTLNGVLQNLGNGDVITAIYGAFTNNGIIKNNSSGYRLILQTYADIHNNGIWENSETHLSGENDQHISQSIGKKFECKFGRTAPNYGRGTGTIIADSDLTFTSDASFLDLMNNWGTLNMSGHNLILEGEFSFYDVVVKNIYKLITEEKVKLYSISFDSDVIIEGVASLFDSYSEASFQKSVTLNGVMQNLGFGSVNISISGNLTNNGIIRNNPEGNELWIYLLGNVNGNGIFYNSRNYFETNGNDNRISGTYHGSISLKTTGDPIGGKIIIADDYYNYGRTQIESGTEVIISNEAKFYNYGELVVNGSLTNYGILYETHKMVNGSLFNYNSISGTYATTPTMDSLKVISYGLQLPSTFNNGVKCWWRLVPSDSLDISIFSILTLKYSDELLNGNSEESLHVFHSADSGKIWKQLSSSANITRDINSNSVTINEVPAYGDYLLSSKPDPISVLPSIVMTFLGRNSIRVGPPNRYTIHYANNSDTPTGEMLMELGLNGIDASIEKIIPSVWDGAPQIEIPIDSLTYDGRKDSVILWINSMAPREERSFEVILSTKPNLARKSNEQALVITLGGVITYAVGTVVITYVKDIAKNMTEEMWLPYKNCEGVGQLFYHLIKNSFSRTNRQWFCREKPVKVLMEQVRDDVLKEGGFEIPGKDFVDATGRAIKGMKRYQNNQYKTRDCAGKETIIKGNETSILKSLTKVFSWDPNEKIGPDGYGQKGYVTTAGTMQYQILFENKKEATAPAWRIYIEDTLSAHLDPTTVKFEKSSHEGGNYNWTTTVEGNIVKWEIFDIELPPNVNPPEGEGYVSFTVMVKDNLPSGTEIKNRANIIFDYNDPILTNQVINTIDFLAPITKMITLPETINGDWATLKWNSTDPENGSGTQSTTVFMSFNDGPFTSVGNSESDTLQVDVSSGTYKFYALSKDKVGNAEKEYQNIIAINVISDVADKNHLPTEYELNQNYPNPFNPTTIIKYSIPEIAKVELKIFDILGREVVTLINQKQNAGSYKVDFNASNLSSGVYFYRLSAGQFSETKKLLLLK